MEHLSTEILFSIAFNLEPQDLLSFCQTKREFSQICQNESFWREKTFRDFSVSSRLKNSWKETYRLYFHYKILELPIIFRRISRYGYEGALSEEELRSDLEELISLPTFFQNILELGKNEILEKKVALLEFDLDEYISDLVSSNFSKTQVLSWKEEEIDIDNESVIVRFTLALPKNTSISSWFDIFSSTLSSWNEQHEILAEKERYPFFFEASLFSEESFQ